MNYGDLTNGLEKNVVSLVRGSQVADLEKFQYICTSIPGKGCDIEQYMEQICGCDCQSNCDPTYCSCMSQSGLSYVNRHLTDIHFAKDISTAILECNSDCSCSAGKCSNRLVQNGIQFKFEAFMTDNKGVALRSLECIPKGSFVCEYAGEILNKEESISRTDALGDNEMNYLIVVNEHCTSGVVQTFVDPKFKGNIGRFINHSCDPNLTMFPVRINSTIPKLALFANKDIAAKEELSFSYGTYDNGGGENSSSNTKRKPCFCASPHCQGYLPLDTCAFT